MMILRFVFLLVLFEPISCKVFEECEHVLPSEFEKQCSTPEGFHGKAAPQHTRQNCKSNRNCPKSLHTTIITHPPFSVLMEVQLKQMSRDCCGYCNIIKTNQSFSDVFTDNSPFLNNSDIIFPVLGKHGAERLYGYWFIPLVPTPPGTFVEKRKTQPEIVADVMTGLSKLWPLLVILLLFSLLAGHYLSILQTGVI